MKKWYLNKIEYFKKNYLAVIVKIILFIAGLLISTLGIAIYASSTVGASQLDWTLYNVSSIIDGYNFETGAMSDEVLKGTYITALNILYMLMVLFTLIFAIPTTLKEYKTLKKKEVWFNLGIVILADIAIAFIAPLVLNFYFNNVIILENIMGNSMSQDIRNWIFMGGFTCFCLGIALWVHAEIVMGPFNNICYQFMKLTNIKYTKARVIIDFCLFLPGVILWFFIPGSWEEKTRFLFKNLGIGTISFTFIAGPYINLFLIFIKKYINYEKLNKLICKKENEKLVSI